MPVSKKRKKQQQKKHEPKHTLINVDNDNRPIEVSPLICYHPFENSKPSINTVYRSGEPCLIKSIYLDNYAKCDKKRMLEAKEYIESVFDNYLKNTTDFDQMLNIYSKSSNEYPVDTLDFSEFTANAYSENVDVTEKAYDIINTPGIEFDASWLWSTSQYFDIIVSPRLMYKILRIGYSETRQSVAYGFTEYERFKLDDDVYFTAPILQGVIDIYCDNCSVDETGKISTKHYAKHHANLDLNQYYQENTHFMKSIVDHCVKKYGNGFNTVRIDLLGDCLINKIAMFEHKQVINGNNKHKPALYNILADFITNYTVNDFDEVQKLADSSKASIAVYRVVRAVSAITASLIVSNKLLKDKKLSKPVKHSNESKNTVSIAEIDIKGQPERKTRILGSNIKIMSAERPETPTMERVIKYHVLEWGRKEHFRRLKSGKIIHVRASQCVRKCADKTQTKVKSSKRATDYKIKPDRKD